MPNVTVLGGGGLVYTLPYTSSVTAAIAQRFANTINSDIQNSTLTANTYSGGSFATTGSQEYVIAGSGTVNGGSAGNVQAIAITAPGLTLTESGVTMQTVLSGAGGLNLNASATGPTGQGTVVAGGTGNVISVSGAYWSITSDGSNISVGGGGSAGIESNGNDTISAGSGADTISVVGGASDVVFGGSAMIHFYAGSGSQTVNGMSGSLTVTGGTGGGIYAGGSAGNNLILAGNGPTTIFGGGNGDQLFANGSSNQEIAAGSGNETLAGGLGTGNNVFIGSSDSSSSDIMGGGAGNDTLYAGAGSDTMIGGAGSDLFAFFNGSAGGTDQIADYNAGQGDLVGLFGYGSNEVAQALASQSTSGGNTTITLSDNTTITFSGVSHLTAANFTT